jgi:hypothetical protein
MTTLTPHRAARHSAEQIEATLVVMALESGNIRRTRAKLKELGVFGKDKVPPATTISRWPDTYKERYAEIRQEVAPRIKARMAETHDDLVTRLTALEHATLDELELELKDLSGKDKAALLRNAAVSAAIHQDKSQLLKGEATQIVKRELPELVRALAAKGVQVEGLVIEGVAEEITPPRPTLPVDTTESSPPE